jgi:hypothetical protein
MSTTSDLVLTLQSLADQLPADSHALRAAAARLSELERENARLREALQLIANAIHPRFRTEDDIDMLYANEKAFGQCINVARAALAGSGEK